MDDGSVFDWCITYAEVLDVVEDVVVESKVAAGDAVDTSILLNLPVSKTKTLSFLEKLGLGDLATPVYIGRVVRKFLRLSDGKVRVAATYKLP
jgi:hypothetical protein